MLVAGANTKELSSSLDMPMHTRDLIFHTSITMLVVDYVFIFLFLSNLSVANVQQYGDSF
ncbi:MAG: hypothetical protein NMNS01_19920 [Nitrosomonas sp.]|nr:MAG: hypothetical protein NMNS01_19920 [Nitrosomonas sp.]